LLLFFFPKQIVFYSVHDNGTIGRPEANKENVIYTHMLEKLNNSFPTIIWLSVK